MTYFIQKDADNIFAAIRSPLGLSEADQFASCGRWRMVKEDGEVNSPCRASPVRIVAAPAPRHRQVHQPQ